MKRITAKSLCAANKNIDQVTASGLLGYLRKIGKATEVGKIKKAGTRGRATVVFEVDEETVLDFSKAEVDCSTDFIPSTVTVPVETKQSEAA